MMHTAAGRSAARVAPPHHMKTQANHVLQLLPKSVPAPLGSGAPSYDAAAAVACDGYPDTLAHKAGAWWPAVPRFRAATC